MATPISALQEKARQSSAPPLGGLVQPANGSTPAGSAPQDSQAPAGAPQDDADDSAGAPAGADNDAEESKELPVQISRDVSRVQEKLTALIDSAGVKRSIHVPYLNEPAENHIRGVANAAKEVGGLSQNILSTFHHGSGDGFGSSHGLTAGWRSDDLKSAIVPKDSDAAKAVCTAANRLVSQAASLIGEKNPAIAQAKSMLQVICKNNLSGMSLFDAAISMTNISHSVVQSLAREYSNSHPDGPAIHLRAPKARNK